MKTPACAPERDREQLVNDAPFGLDPAFGDEYLTEKEPVDERDLPEETQEGGAE